MDVRSSGERQKVGEDDDEIVWKQLWQLLDSPFCDSSDHREIVNRYTRAATVSRTTKVCHSMYVGYFCF